MRRLAKILFIFLFTIIGGFGPEATENSNDVLEKLVPANLRLTNAMSDIHEFEGFERVFKYFLKRWDIVGASVAVAKEGRLIYAKGFGYTDSTLHQPVEPYHRFRIASISKLITAVAIMKLNEEGKLSVYDRVFGVDGILNDPFYANPRDKRVYGITIAHLLSHEGGWTTRWGDQMFMPQIVAASLGVSLPVDTKTIVRFALNKNLHFTPGTGRSYSNLGYAILGLVAEKVTGMSYSDYCRKHILEPCGIYDMQLAKNMPEEKAPWEVTYYEPPDAVMKPSIYGTGDTLHASYGGNDIEALGAAGAWIATTPDLVKLVLMIDGDDNVKDILNEESVDFMTNPERRYAPVGWKATLENSTWWRTGSFPGTAGMIKKEPDGTVWAVLLNTSSWNGPEISTEIHYFMARALAQVKKWPERDLFALQIQAPLSVDLHLN